MSAVERRGGLVVALLAVTSCSPEPTPANRNAPAPAAAQTHPATAMLEAMGGRTALEAVTMLVLKGNGTRTRMGQIAAAGGIDPSGELLDLTATIDLANGRAGFNYTVVNGAFRQQRTEVYTRHRGEPVGWTSGPDRPAVVTSPNGLFSWATQNSPEMLLRRNPISVALAAAETLARTPQPRDFNGRSAQFIAATLPWGEDIGLYFNSNTGLLDGFTTLDTETMLGDVEAQYIYADYRAVGDLTLPHSVTVLKQGRPYASIEYEAISVNPVGALELFAVPADAVEQANQVVAAAGAWAPLDWNTVAPNIYHAVGYSHHSMVVEFPSFVVVIEGPYTEAQSLALGERIDAEIGKPIRYVAPTHPHYDHTGGIRGLAALGATVVVAQGHEAELRAIVEARHSNPPDMLAQRIASGAELGTLESFSGTTAIEEGEQRVELYEVQGIPHVSPKMLAFVPSAGVLFQSDLFFGGPSPDATALYRSVRELELDVETIVGGHGGVLPFAALVEAASGSE